METVRWKNKKNNSFYRSYGAQLMGWMHLMIFKQISSMRRLIQDNGGQTTVSTFFKKDRFLHLMIANFENASSHKYVLQKANSF